MDDMFNAIFKEDLLESYTVDEKAKEAYIEASKVIRKLHKQGRAKAFRILDVEKPLAQHEISVIFADESEDDNEITSASIPKEILDIIDTIKDYFPEGKFCGNVFTTNNNEIELTADVIIYHKK